MEYARWTWGATSIPQSMKRKNGHLAYICNDKLTEKKKNFFFFISHGFYHSFGMLTCIASLMARQKVQKTISGTMKSIGTNAHRAPIRLTFLFSSSLMLNSSSFGCFRLSPICSDVCQLLNWNGITVYPVALSIE